MKQLFKWPVILYRAFLPTEIIALAMLLLIFTQIERMIEVIIAFDIDPDTIPDVIPDEYQQYIAELFAGMPRLVIVAKFLLRYLLMLSKAAVISVSKLFSASRLSMLKSPVGTAKAVSIAKQAAPTVVKVLYAPPVKIVKTTSLLTRIAWVKRLVNRYKWLGRLVWVTHEVSDYPLRLGKEQFRNAYLSLMIQINKPLNLWFVSSCGLAWVAMYSHGDLSGLSGFAMNIHAGSLWLAYGAWHVGAYVVHHPVDALTAIVMFIGHELLEMAEWVVDFFFSIILFVIWACTSLWTFAGDQLSRLQH